MNVFDLHQQRLRYRGSAMGREKKDTLQLTLGSMHFSSVYFHEELK